MKPSLRESPRPRSRASRGAVWLLLFALALVALEAGSAAALLVLARLRPSHFALQPEHFFERVAKIDEQTLRRRAADETYDAVLGWRNAPGSEHSFVNTAGRTWTIHYDADGARRSTVPAHDSLIATFGDSFTECDEVNDDETWQHELSLATGTRVVNFGVGAYGTDQALLLLERKLAGGLEVPILVLAIHEENINRIVNRYRPFYLPNDPLLLGFKPRFLLDEGRLRLLPNPLALGGARPRPIREYVEAAAHDDYWFERNAQRPRTAFPFSVQLLWLIRDVALERGWLAVASRPTLSRDLWSEPHAQRLMAALVERFVEVSRRHGTTPVLLLVPEIADPETWEATRVPYRGWLDALRGTLDGSGLGIVDVADAPFDVQRFRVQRGRGHASPYGNRIIAQALSPMLAPLVRRERSSAELARRPRASRQPMK